MVDCDGEGYCLERRHCTCSSDRKCTCGHRDCEGDYWCPVLCGHYCKPIRCPNYSVCHREVPKYVLDIYRGICGGPKCLWLGKLMFTRMKDECVICCETKRMVKLECDHMFCSKCIQDFALTSKTYPAKCPLCRGALHRNCVLEAQYKSKQTG
jgi:hypothetical protein